MCLSGIAKPRKEREWPEIRRKRPKKNKKLYVILHDFICVVKRDQSFKSLKDETNVDLLGWGKEPVTLNPICMRNVHCASVSIPRKVYPASRC
jgi:hypothetical protein